jgi:hypothetical protein
MKEKDPTNQINDLDDKGFKSLLDELFDDPGQTIGSEKDTPKNVQPIISREIEDTEETKEALRPLQDAIDSERDEFGNYVIPDNREPLTPPIAPKSTPAGRDLLDTLTSNPNYNRPNTK